MAMHRRSDREQAKRELIRRARFELACFMDDLARDILPDVDEEFEKAVDAEGLGAVKMDRKAMETRIRHLVLLALDVKEVPAHVAPLLKP